MNPIIIFLILFIIICLFIVLFIIYQRHNYEISLDIYNQDNQNNQDIQVFQFNGDLTNLDHTDDPSSPFKEIIQKNNFNMTEKFKNANLILFSDYSYIDQNIGSVSFIKNIKYYIYAINGSDEMASKSNLAKYIRDAHYEKYIPKSFVIDDDNDMNEFKNQHKDGNVYMIKKNLQRQEGNLITSDINFILNGSNEENYVVCQELLQDPYIVNKRKINLRIYLLVIIHNNKADFYIYKNGFMYYTPKYFEKGNPDKDMNITTGYIDRQVYIDNPLTIQDFYEHIGKDKTELLQNNMITMFKAIKEVYHDVLVKKNKNIPGYKFNIFGCDVAPNDKLETMLIEINKGPSLDFKDIRDQMVKQTLVIDCFTLIGLTKDGNINNFIEV